MIEQKDYKKSTTVTGERGEGTGAGCAHAQNRNQKHVAAPVRSSKHKLVTVESYQKEKKNRNHRPKKKIETTNL